MAVHNWGWQFTIEAFILAILEWRLGSHACQCLSGFTDRTSIPSLSHRTQHGIEPRNTRQRGAAFEAGMSLNLGETLAHYGY